MHTNLRLLLEHKKKQGENGFEFAFSVLNGPLPRYAPGQFITLLLSIGGKEIRRSYSLSSIAEAGDDRLCIGVKRVQNGLVSRYLTDHLEPGDQLNALPPSGRFTLPEDYAGKHLVYYAAGSGIVPVYAHLRFLSTLPDPPRTTLFYSNTHERSAMYLAELFSLAKITHNRLDLRLLFSQPQSDLYKRRRLNNTFVEDETEKLMNESGAENLRFYLCGPFSYMRMIRLTLQFSGIGKAQIRTENFVVETAEQNTLVEHFERRRITLRIAGKTYTFDVEPAQSILDAALRLNIELPYSCKGGICASCAAKCRRGQVAMTINEVLSPADLARGDVLTCTGHPLSDDVLIEFP